MLDTLPFELLSIVYEYLPTAKTLSHLCLTCRHLNDYTRKEGWKVFLQSQFPSLPKPPDSNVPKVALDAVRGLTTLSRNWDRKAFIARYLEPRGDITSLNTGKRLHQWRRPGGQTMGYRPSIDSYEKWSGGDWTSRNEVLAWSAGTDILLKTKRTHDTLSTAEREMADNHRVPKDVHDGRLTSWFTYSIPDSWEGRDDITAMKMIRPGQHSGEFDQGIAYGTANQDLSFLWIMTDDEPGFIKQRYSTDRSQIVSLDISPSSPPLLTVTLLVSGSESILALYPIHDSYSKGTGDEPIQPLSVVRATDLSERACRSWTTQFLSGDRVAVGVGPSSEPIRIHEVTPTGLSSEPVRSFAVDDPNVGRPMSVYPVTPLSIDSKACHEPGQVFLSGCFDGKVRLHDLRSPSAYETMYWDPTNEGAIYSLVTQGRERIIAGGSQHSMLKIFDLRVAGGRMYHYPSAHVPASSAFRGTQQTGWDIFLNPRQDARSRTGTSPVYSLSIPNSSSPTIFAGVEGAVTQFDFTSIADKHPDPLFKPAIERFPRTGEIDVKRSWNRNGEVLNLAAYEQVSPDGGLGMRLHIQRGVGKYGDAKVVEGWDYRWKDPGEEPLRSEGSTLFPRRGGWRGRRGWGRGRGRGG